MKTLEKYSQTARMEEDESAPMVEAAVDYSNVVTVFQADGIMQQQV